MPKTACRPSRNSSRRPELASSRARTDGRCSSTPAKCRSAASARARLANLRDGPWQNRQGEPHVVGRVPDGVLPGLAEALQAAPISRREAQLLRMGHAALAEVLEALPDGVEVPLLLGLPEHHAMRPIDPAGFLRRLHRQSGAPLDLARSIAVPRERWGRLLIVSLFNIVGWNVLAIYGVGLLPSGRAALLGYTMPLWSTLLSIRFLGDRMTARSVIGLLLGLGQFVTTFAITMAYVSYANRRVDPLSAEIRGELEKQEAKA